MHFIKLSSENVCIHIYFNAHRHLISMVSLTSSSSHSFIHTHTRLIVCFFRLPTFNSLRRSRNSRSLYVYLYMMRSENVDDDRFHTLSIYSRASHRRISKNIYTHTCTRMWWYTNTHDYIIHLYNSFPSISQSDQ